ncbi:hypothetical protein AALB53_19305 [Lachnospiraceae bacterium 47-T17]
MSKFILIDQSIRGNGGHYLEYATNVLNEAKKMGYCVGLATNKDFHEKAPWDVFPIYKYDIWGSTGKKKVSFYKTRSLAAKIRRVLVLERSKFHFSLMGQFLTFFKRRDFSASIKTFGKFGFLSQLGICVSGAILLLLFMLYKIIKGVYNLICKTPLLGGLIHKFAMFMQKIRTFMVKALKQMKRVIHYRSWEKNFYKSTRKTIEHFQIGAGDIIFIPTLAVPDMSAVAKCIHVSKPAQKASWHMIFRRNMFQGREPVYSFDDIEVKAFRKALLYFKNLTEQWDNAFFYTDTERLTAQYEYLNIYNFSTLPIPIDPDLQKNKFPQNSGPITLTYLGDARREKGYQFLNSIVDELWEEYIVPKKIDFNIQSNYTFCDIKSNYDVVYAMDQLSLYDSSAVKMCNRSMGGKEYADFVAQGNIGLLFYDRENYYARSSGALIECICTGMPVIVPSASWLAIDVDRQNYRYIDSLKANLEMCVFFDSEWMTAQAYQEKEAANISCLFENGILSFSDYDNRVVKICELVEHAAYLTISYKIFSLIQCGNYVRTKIILKDKYGLVVDEFQSDNFIENEKVNILYPVKADTYTAEIYMWAAFYKQPIKITDIQIEFWNSDHEIPLGSYGLVYSNEADITPLLRNMIDFYADYRNAAIKQAKRYNQYHTAENLVKTLALGEAYDGK